MNQLKEGIKMIKSEWKSLFHNKLLLIVLLAIIAIPVIYAGFFLNSMWDPYGNVDKLPVAIVNEDQPVKYEGSTLKVGEEMVEELKKNDSLQFNFVDARTASAGLRNGTYYMVVTIPENFSENAATLMDEEPQKMELNYETNPGTNYIASKMSETALTKIKDSVQQEVVKTYTETVFDQIEEAGDGMQEAADGASELKDGIQKAADGNQTITENLNTLADSTVTFTKGTKTLQSGLKKYTEGVAVLNQKAPVLITGTATLNQGAQDLSEGAGSLSEGAKEYVAGAETFADGTKSYVEGAQQLAAGAAQLEPLEKGLGTTYYGIRNLYEAAAKDNYDGSGSPSLTTGTKELQKGLETIYDSVEQLEGTTSAEGLKKLSENLINAGEGIKKGAEGMTSAGKTIDASAQAISQGEAVLENGRKGLNQSADQANTELADSADRANTQIDQANDTISKANKKIASIDSAAETTNSQIGHAKSEIDQAVQALEAAEKEAKDQGIEVDLSAQVQKLKTAKGNISEVGTVEELALAKNIDPIEKADTIQTDKTTADSITNICGELEKASKGLAQGAGQMTAGAKELEKGAGNLPADIPSNPVESLKTGLKQAVDGATAVNGGAQKIAAGLGQLESGTKDFPKAGQGIAALNDGFDTLTANDKKLTEGADTLKKQGTNLTKGAEQVSRGAGQLAQGTKTLSSGAGQLTEGVSTLASNSGTLNDGAAQLAKGSGQIQSGSAQLAKGSGTLGEGMEQLNDGSGQLEEALSDGAEEIKGVKAEDENIDMFASPVTDQETKMTEVKNNGHAMAPYMMSVGLWVGALAFCLIYPLMQYKGKLKSGFSWWLSKASVLYPVAVLQGLLLIVLLHVTIGFAPAEMGKTIAFSCLSAVTFTSIMYFFNITLGKVGSFLMLVFMVIQLAGSAGTYPVEISPEFVAKIHWYLPFTYTVNSFRSTIAGGESIKTAVIVMSVLFVIFTALTIGAFQIKAKRKKEGRPIFFDWLEERGLA